MKSSEENKIAAEGSDRVRRQVFIPSNVNTNTFVFDTVSFLSLLTLVVFIVRVFNRVMESNNLQKLSVGADPSLSRSFQNTHSVIERGVIKIGYLYFYSGMEQ